MYITASWSRTARFADSPRASTRPVSTGCPRLRASCRRPDRGDAPGAKRVAAVRQLAHVAALDQGAHQSVDRGQRQAGPGGELAQADLAPGVADDLEQVEHAADRLHAAVLGWLEPSVLRCSKNFRLAEAAYR